MPPKSTWIGELSRTKIASIGLFSSVHPHVNFVVPLFGKAFTACIAGEWSFAIMFTRMSLYLVELARTVRTYGASEFVTLSRADIIVQVYGGCLAVGRFAGTA